MLLLVFQFDVAFFQVRQRSPRSVVVAYAWYDDAKGTVHTGPAPSGGAVARRGREGADSLSHEAFKQRLAPEAGDVSVWVGRGEGGGDVGEGREFVVGVGEGEAGVAG